MTVVVVTGVEVDVDDSCVEVVTVVPTIVVVFAVDIVEVDVVEEGVVEDVSCEVEVDIVLVSDVVETICVVVDISDVVVVA